MSVDPNTQQRAREPLVTLDLESYTQRYWDLKGHDRTCFNCGRLRREANTRPSDQYFEDSYRSTLKDVYTGEQPRDRRYTEHDHYVGVACSECGTTDSHTLVYEGETLSTGDLLARAEGVFAALEELYDLDVDTNSAIDYIKRVKQDPERTNTSADDILESAVVVGLASADSGAIEDTDYITEDDDS